MKNQDVTVVVINYNYSEFLPHAIESVFRQIDGRPKLLIVDDCSTDASVFIIEEHLKKWRNNLANFEYMVNEKNIGVAESRNKALDRLSAEGREWVIFLDADDALERNYVQETIKVADDDAGVDVVYTGHMRVNAANEIIEHDVFVPPRHNPLRLRTKNYIHCSALHKISDIRFQPSLPSLEDWVYWMMMSKEGLKFKRCDTTGLYYRRHGESRNSVTGNKVVKTKEGIRDILGTYCLWC